MKSFSEMLKGKQHKIDKNKNGKVDAHDFKLLRKEEQELEEAVGRVETKKYSWGTMKTVHHGSEFSVPMHPEHHKAIAKLKDNQEHKFRDETGRDWTAKRMGDKVHIHGANNGGKTVVKHSDLKEELDEKFISGREYASQGVMHPDHAKMAIHKVTGQSVDFYASKTGDKMHGVVKKNDGKEVHIQAHKGVGDGKLHKFKVTPNLPKPVSEGLDEATPNKQQVKQAIGIARDKRYAGGNMTGAVKAMDKLNKGLAQHPAVKKELQKQNEEVEELDELSKSTLASYAKKAVGSSYTASRIASRSAALSGKESKPMQDIVSKRADGIKKAVNRLAKEEVELDEVKKATGDLKDACWKGYTAVGMKMKNGKKVPNCVPVKEEDELDEKMNMAKADMGDVIKDFQKSDAPQFVGKSQEKRRQMAIAAKLQADRMKKEGVEMKSYKQFMEELYNKLPEEETIEEEVEQIDELSKSTLASYAKKATHDARIKHGIGKDFERVGGNSRKPEYKAGAKKWEDKYKSDARKREAGVGKAIDRLAKEEVEQIDELDKNLIKSIMKNPIKAREKTSSDEIDPRTGKLKPYGYRGKSEYEKSETGDDQEPKKRGRKTGITIGTYKRRQPK